MDDFQTTHWSLVVAAGQRLSPQSDRALSELCRKYWLPLYGYVRRRVADVHEAQDLTQDFFCRVLERNFFAAADPGRGRFRAFLLTSLKHFLANEWEKRRTQKRGGGLTMIELDFAVGESRLSLEPAHEETPERLFDRQWALTLLDLVLARLRAEFRVAGKEDQFEQLKPFLSGARERTGESYSEAGRAAGMTAEAVKVAAHRLRQRYRELLRAEIAQTVAQPGDVDDEIRDLFQVLGS
jgi:RNA polymerase sigma-70 factor (ECF subfamily)